MSDKPTFVLGDRIEHTCATCGEDGGHIVSALGKKGQITRITCPMCNSSVPYKLNMSAPRERAASKQGNPYDQGRIYRKGETLTHQTFGSGQVTALIQPNKMDVLFADRLRRLVCGTHRA